MLAIAARFMALTKDKAAAAVATVAKAEARVAAAHVAYLVVKLAVNRPDIQSRESFLSPS